MRAYQATWRAVMGLLAAVSLVAGLAEVGWPTVLGATAAFAALGALTGFSWVEDPARRGRAMTEGALWFGAAGLLIVGLPPTVGPWTVPILVLVGAACPALVEAGLATYRKAHPGPPADHPEALAERDLERRWRQTTDELRSAASPSMKLRLVQERAQLLEELERRDPARFSAWLVRTGWHEPQDQ